MYFETVIYIYKLITNIFLMNLSWNIIYARTEVIIAKYHIWEEIRL